MPRISLESSGPYARTPSPGPTRQARALASSSDRRKLAIAGVLLVLGAGAISWNLFLSDLLRSPRLTDNDLWQDGKAPTPEQESRNQETARKASEQLDGYVKSAGISGS